MSEYGWVEERSPPAAGPAVSYLSDIRAAHQDAFLLEQIYQAGRDDESLCDYRLEQLNSSLLTFHS